MNLEQIRDYVNNDKPVSAAVAKEWLRWMLEENEKVNDKWLDVHSKLSLVEEDLFYEKRSNEENHAKYVAAYHELAAKDKVLEWYADENNRKLKYAVNDYRRFISEIDVDKGHRARTILAQ